MAFIFDPSKGETPETLRRKREIAAALRQSAIGTPSSPGEGLSMIGAALGARLAENRADKAAAYGQQQASAGFAPIIAALGGGGQIAPASPSASAGAPAASPPAGANASYIREGLTKRGLPGHVADAFVANFQDESGLNPGINEAKPLVPGSRGGFGLYQLTGPRRVAYENFAKQRGVSVDDTDAQLDFLMMEMQGPEASAAKSILSAPDTATAAQAIVRDFLRPAAQHRDSRMAKYASLSGSDTPAAAAISAIAPQGAGLPQQAAQTMQPAAPRGMQPMPVNSERSDNPDMARMVAQAGNAPAPQQTAPQPAPMAAQPGPAAAATQPGSLGLPQLLQIAQNPWVAENPLYGGIVKTLVENQLQMNKPMDPLEKAQLEKLLIETEQLRNPRMSPADEARIGLDREKFAAEQNKPTAVPGTSRLVGPDGKVILDAVPDEPNKPSGILEYEYAKQQGFPGTFQDWEASKKGGMSLQIDPATGAVTFQQGGNMKPLTEQQSKDAVFSTRAEGALPKIDEFGDALTGVEGTVGGSIGQIPMVGNFAKSERYQQAEQAGKEFLQAILRKDTGAAITPQETAEYGSVYLPRPGDGPAVLEQKKTSRRRALEAMKAGMPPQAILAQEKALLATGDRAPAPPQGVDPSLWEVMTPEERALWQN